MKLERDRLRITAVDLSNHLACPHLTTLDCAAAAGRIEAPTYRDSRLDALWERGAEHERGFVDHLRHQGFEVVEIPLDFDADKAHWTTVQAISSGVAVVAQATLLRGDWVGRADVLRRVERPSRLGGWSYEVWESKLARETRAGTLLQLCLYSSLLASAQGLEPEWVYVVPPGEDFEPERFRIADFSAYFRLVSLRFEAAVRSPDEDSYPVPTAHCGICRWWRRCDARWRGDDFLTLVAGLHRTHLRELENWGVRSVAGLAALPLPIARRPVRGARETYRKLREQARLQLESRERERPVFELLLPPEPDRGLSRLPEPSPGDLFLDLEGDPFVTPSGIEYLLGFVVFDPDGELEHHARWALDRESEKTGFEWLVDEVWARWQRHPGLHIYHFTSYEPAALKRLMGRYATREDEIDRFLRAGLFVDLHSIVRQALRAGVEQYSLKALEPLHEFERVVPLREASKALRAVEAGLELRRQPDLDPELRRAIEDYNGDDCRSIVSLRDWLESLRRKLVADGTEIARPAPKSGDPSEELGDWLQRSRALALRLLTGIPADPTRRSPAQQARWLAAHLLDWHRREAKVRVWEKFHLSDLGDEERLEEPGAVSGLRFVSREGGTPRCPIDRYEFPPQEVEIRGEQLFLDAETAVGELVRLDIATRTIEIKKRQTCRDLHPPSVFGYFQPKTGNLEESLARLGEWIADYGADVAGAHRAARDLLLREPPRGPSATGSPLRRSGEAILAAGCRLALELDEGVLPVQGPPGSGKTFTAARMIIELVRAGRRVGVTASSHKVIRNLLENTVRAAHEAGEPLRCIQKTEPGSPADPAIEETNDYPAVVAALGAGRAKVAAGTAWMWSRPEFANTVDVLFVDEAGQMSLANALAIAQAAHSLILVGDPQQLEQPLQGTHPEGTELSVLEHLLGGLETVPADRGLFLEDTWRLHPEICRFTSEQFYEGRLRSRQGLETQVLRAPLPFDHSGLFFAPVEHDGNQNCSVEEAERIAKLVRSWLDQRAFWIDHEDRQRALTLEDVLIVAPYNAQVAAIAERLPGGHVGTVDKFQGQEAPVVIYSMSTSSPEDAPRGMGFLYSRHRLNVATSRAKCVCVLVASPRLFEPDCRTPHQMRLANALCRYRELATEVRI